MSALKKLLDGDLEHRSFILRRQEEVQAQYTYAKKAAEVFADCLATTSAVKDAFAASILSTKALEEALKNALNLYDNHQDILATISSTKGMLATWAEIVALTEALLTHLDKAAPQVETHLHLAADEHAAHESAHIAASESVLSCTDSLRAVDRSIAQKKEYYLVFVPYQPKSSCESSSRRSTRDNARSSLLYPRTMTQDLHIMISMHF
jgi:translation initiation factor 2B subunit (eIF-2B alpha/beta/delta family)